MRPPRRHVRPRFRSDAAEPRSRSWAAAAGLWWPLAALLAGGCVSTIVDDPLQPSIAHDPIVIDLGSAPATTDERIVRELYESVLQRIHAAHADRDAAAMLALIDGHLRPEAPEWARQRLLGCRSLAAGLRCEQHARTAAIAVVAVVPPTGAASATAGAAAPPAADTVPDAEVVGTALEFELTLPPLAGSELRLAGRGDDDAVAFQVDVGVRDHFLDGSVRDHGDSDILRLDRAVALGVEALRLPVLLDLGDSTAVRREIDVRIDLLPGYVRAGDDRAPVRRTTMAACRATQWPASHRAVRKEPLASLRRAQQAADPARWVDVRLGAEFATAADRPAVERALIDWVRLGSTAQATVAMASLRAVGCAEIPVGDRDAWLAWWQGRR